MATMVVTGDRTLEAARAPVPRPGPHDLLLRVIVTGICGSDLATYRGSHSYKRPPVVIGHELCGMVVATGSRVTGFAPGERVTAAAYAPCWQCPACRQGRVNICGSIRNLCTTSWPGAFAEYLLVDARAAFPVGSTLTADQTALVEPLAVGLHAARLGAVRSGDRVLVVGAGTIGLAALIGLQATVPDAAVTCADVADLKRDLSLAFGADGYLDLRDAPPVPAGAFDVTVIASPDPSTPAVAAAATRAGGTVVVVASFTEPVPVELIGPVRRELTYRFSALALPGDFRDVIAWIEAGTVDPTGLVTHRFALADAGRALRLLDAADGTVGKALVYPGGTKEDLL
jgi:threonine dehydrogenase-like Zn-dependent dehydrogenase